MSGPISIPTAAACCRSCSRTGFGFERYVDYMLDVPMYFVYRDGNYIDASGPVVPRFHGRQAAGPAGRNADDERLGRSSRPPPSPRCGSRRYLEMRGADGGPWRAALRAAGAVGRAALRQRRARRRLRPGRGLDRGGARGDAPRGAAARARRAASAAAPCATSRSTCSRSPASGLHRRARLDSTGAGRERISSTTLFEIAGSGRTPADESLEDYNTRWDGNVDRSIPTRRIRPCRCSLIVFPANADARQERGTRTRTPAFAGETTGRVHPGGRFTGAPAVPPPSSKTCQRAGSASSARGGRPESDIQRSRYQLVAPPPTRMRAPGGGAARPSADHGSSISATMRGWSAPK